MKKINILLRVTATILLLAGCVSAASDEPVYLKVDNAASSSFDQTADWAPLPNALATSDGDLLTRWSSNYTDNQWISFDFGKAKVVNKIIIFWEQAYAADYDVLVSLDNQKWQTILSLKGRGGKTDEIKFADTKARYVKILSVKRVNPDWGISIWETLFFGPAGDNPQDKPLAGVYPQIADKLAGKEASTEKEGMEEAVASPGAIQPTELQKGVVYTSWSRTELGSTISDRTLEYLKELGVRHIGIMVVWYQDEVDGKNIYLDAKDTPEDKALVHAINKAHALGIKVMLKPHVDIKTGQWRGDIIPSAEWFASYKDYILYYAKLAGLYNVELFSIGTELGNTTTPQWQSDWEDIIKEVRKVFPGPLIYSANWNEYEEVGFWDKLDYIGIDAYFCLTTKKEPTKEELIVGWKNNALLIDNWLKQNKINKPVVFTEIGYCSANGTNIQPWSVLSNLSESEVDQAEQADALEAMLAVCPSYPWFKGFYWWNYFPQERWSPLGYTIKGKKAEKIFSEWLKK